MSYALLGLKQRRMLISMEIEYLNKEQQSVKVTARDYFTKEGVDFLTDEYSFIVSDIDEIKSITQEYQEQISKVFNDETESTN